MDPKMYPTGSQAIPDSAVDTSPTGTDKIVLIRGNNLMKAITLANLFASAPDMGGTTPGKVITDGLFLDPVTVTDDGALVIAADKSLYLFNKTTPKIEATIAAPVAGRILIFSQIDGGTAGHTITLAGSGTWDGTNDVATLNSQFETLVVLGISATRFMELINLGSISYS